MKKIKKFTALLTMILAFNLAFLDTALPLSSNVTASAATIKISKKKATLTKGQSITLKIKGTKKKAKWSSSNKSVATVSSKGKVKAKKVGKTTIMAKVAKKSLKCKVKVEKKHDAYPESPTPIETKTPVPTPTLTPTPVPNFEPGSKENPLSAYTPYTTDIYDYETNIGKFTIQLLDYKDGQDAYGYVMKNEINDEPTESQEYIYVKFKIDYLSGQKEVSATEVVNHYSNFYNSVSNYQLENNGWGFGFEDVEDMVNISLYPGGSAICSKAIIVRSGNTPITYRIQTGYDRKNYVPIYTWFTTKN